MSLQLALALLLVGLASQASASYNDQCPDNYSWTNWFDHDDPSYSCDCEQLYKIRRTYKGQVCDKPTAIQAREVDTKHLFNSYSPNIRISPTYGFICKNSRHYRCKDYEVRFCCPPVAPKPQCRRPLIEDENLIANPSDQEVFEVGGKIWFKCERPYTLVGRSDIVCQENGEFNAPVPACVACPQVNAPENGSLRPEQDLYSVGQRVDFRCNDGFRLEGPGWIKCQDNGKFNDDPPVCIPDSCPRPDVDRNVRLHPDQRTYDIGQRVDFRCNKGFRLEGPGWLKCQDNGQFNGNPPRCVPDVTQCQRPDDPANGRVDARDKDDQDLFDDGDKIWFRCDDGYSLVGDKDFRCQRDGSWKPQPFPTCVACQRPATPADGSLRPVQDIYKVGQRVEFKCNDGFKRVGESSIKCQENGQFDDPPPVCVPDSCPRPDVDDNVRLNPDRRTYNIGQRVDFRCDKGFRLEGPGWLKCQDNGEFNGNPPTCVPDSCPRPDVDRNVRLHPDERSYDIGQRVDFRCDKGFRLEGPGWLKCQDNGQFNGNPPRCVPDVQLCQRPDDPANGRVDGRDNDDQDQFKPGQKVWFKCDPHYTLVGDKDFVCQKDGSWKPQPFPRCVACPRPDEPENGSLRPDQEIYRVGQRVDFKCDDGFKLEGPGWIKCQDDGEFNDDPPKCVRKDDRRRCPRPEDPENGRVIVEDEDDDDDDNDFVTPGNRVWFKCDKGFDLVGTMDFTCQKDGTYKPDDEFPKCVAPSGHRTIVACERDYRKYVRCPRGYKIKVVSGFYGRDDRHTCPSKYIYSTDCFAKNGLEKLKEMCENRYTCRLRPGNHWFGDPCHGTHKYIELTYYCRKH